MERGRPVRFLEERLECTARACDELARIRQEGVCQERRFLSEAHDMIRGALSALPVATARSSSCWGADLVCLLEIRDVYASHFMRRTWRSEYYTDLQLFLEGVARTLYALITDAKASESEESLTLTFLREFRRHLEAGHRPPP